MDILGQMFWAYFSKVAVYGFLIFAIFCSENCSKECGIAADLVDAICDEFGFICMGDAGAPVIFHGQFDCFFSSFFAFPHLVGLDSLLFCSNILPR